MKQTGIAVLMISFCAAGAYAQEIPVKMMFSGTNVATTINLLANTVTDEQHSAGFGSLGQFTFRELHADGAASQPPVGCAGPFFGVLAGAGAFRFQDGSLLTVRVTDGAGCIDPVAGSARLTVTYEITGGTGRFQNATGSLWYTATMKPLLRNAANNPALLTLTGDIEGVIKGAPHQ